LFGVVSVAIETEKWLKYWLRSAMVSVGLSEVSASVEKVSMVSPPYRGETMRPTDTEPTNFGWGVGGDKRDASAQKVRWSEVGNKRDHSTQRGRDLAAGGWGVFDLAAGKKKPGRVPGQVVVSWWGQCRVRFA
jgi:hypothetical protein